MQLNGGNPVVSYSAPGALKLAECTAGCATATPTWVITTLDSDEGWMPSLQLKGDHAFVTYHGFNDDRSEACGRRLAAAPVSTGTAVEYFHASFDHYFITDIPAEITALDAGQFVGWDSNWRILQGLSVSYAGASSLPLLQW